MLGLAQAREGNFAEALGAFDEALRLEGGAQDASLMAAYTHIQLGSPDKALALVSDLVERDPSNAAHQNLAGALHMMLRNIDTAAAHFERATAIDPEFEAPYLNLAELARQEGRYVEALERYGMLLKADSANIGALRGMAEVAASRKMPHEMVQWLERIRKIEPGLIEDRLTLLRAYLSSNRTIEALAEANDLLRLAGDNPKVVVAAAFAEHEGGSVAAARSLLRELSLREDLAAIDLDRIAAAQSRLNFPGDARTTREATLQRWPARLETRYGFALESIRAADLSTAETQVDYLKSRFPEGVQTLVASGELALARGSAAAAVGFFERAMAKSPRPGIAKRLAKALIESGETERAIALFAERSAKDGKNTSERMALAALFVKAGRFGQAARIYEAILQLAPENWKARNNLAWTYQKLGDPRAVPEARRALAQNAQHPATLDTAGWILAQNGETLEALRLLREALARDSQEPAIRIHLAETLIELGHLAEAREHLEQVGGAAPANLRRRAAELRANIGG